jgi:translocation and assembly module TamB
VAKNAKSPDRGQAPASPAGARHWRARRDWGRVVAKALCGFFALVGLLPLGLGGLARLDSVQSWLARETAATLRRELGITARYELSVQPWPLELAMDNVVVDASDGGSPFLEASRAVARPRIFSLLAGKLDLGEVSIESPKLRIVVREGKLGNLKLELPETQTEERPTQRELPLSSVSVTDGRLDLQIDAVRVRSTHLDLDLTADEGPLEISARAGLSRIDRAHASPYRPDEDMVDEDVLCRADLRAQLAPDAILVRRLRLLGALDLDAEPGSSPGCDLDEDDWRRLELRLESLRVTLEDGAPRSVDGRVWLRMPTAVAHRFVAFPPLGGYVTVDLDAHYDGSSKLPSLRGSFAGSQLSIDSRVLVRSIEAQVDTSDDRIRVTAVKGTWAGGSVQVKDALIDPFAPGVTLVANGVDIGGMQMADLLDDLSAHPRAHVSWLLERGTVSRFGGTIDPLNLSGPLRVSTRDFGVFDRPFDDPKRSAFMAVPGGVVAGTFKVTPDAVVLSNFDVNTGRSHLLATVSLGFTEKLDIAVAEGGEIDLADVSPLARVPMSGKARVRVTGYGTFNRPLIDADLAVRDFTLGGFPLGQLERAKVHFEPLNFEVREGRLTHGQSAIDIPRMKLDFDAGADVLLTASVDSRTKAGLRVRDFFEMVRFDDNPSLAGIDGVALGPAEVRFVLGGAEDRCRSGRLRVSSRLDFPQAVLAGERWDGGSVDGDLVWEDMNAGLLGLSLELRSAVLRKGPGTIVARGGIELGGKLGLDVTGAAIPLDRLAVYQSVFGAAEPAAAAPERAIPGAARAAADAAGAAPTGRTRASGRAKPGPKASPVPRRDAKSKGPGLVRPEGTVSFVAAIGGTVEAVAGKVDFELSPLRIGPRVLPASSIQLALEPSRAARRRGPTTVCGYPRAEPPGAKRTEPGPLSGAIRLGGALFGGQVGLDDLEISLTGPAMLSGMFTVRQLDLGALANLLPGVAFSAAPPRGTLSATVYIDEMPLGDPGLAEVRVFLQQLELEQSGQKLAVRQVAEPLVFSGDALRVPELPVEAGLSTGLKARLFAGGTIDNLSTKPTFDLGVRLDPVDLSALGMTLPQVDRAQGMVTAQLRLGGPVSDPTLTGGLSLEHGAVRIRGFPLPIENIRVKVLVSPGEIQIAEAEAELGSTGSVSLQAHIPLRGFEIAGATAQLEARGIKVPLADGVKVTADASLAASYTPEGDGSATSLPNVTGTVTLTSFSYTRPMKLIVDLDQLTARAPTEIDSYDPREDFVAFDITLISPEPLALRNNLLDLQLQVAPPGLQLAGTNQRFGARGSLRVVQGSKLMLQGHDFAIRDGTVTFDNPTRIAPRLDVRASTELRRYATNAQVEPTATTTTTASTGASPGGKWRIDMHATGDTDEPEVRFSSDPPLSQEDIVLLLQIGMTRAELDRATAVALAQSVGLEALSAATGLDQAVRSSVPLIDEFRISSQYSSRTGRTEPTATVGKRITNDIRASVTTGLTDNRELRSNVEWKLGNGVSVEGSYDNVNDISNTGIGNLGADLRWRIEFE